MVRDNFSGWGRYLALGLVLTMALFSFYGCSGDDGAAGAPGAKGDPGDQGNPGPVTDTEEACIVCHGTGSLADVAAAHPDPAEQLTVTVTSIANIADQIQVDFTMTDESGAGVAGIGLDSNRFYISDIVPAGTATANLPKGTWDTDYLERWAYERDSTGYPLGTFTDLGGGDYQYTFATLAGSPEAIANAPEYDPAHAQRVVMRIDGRNYGFGRAVGIQDFLMDGTPLAPQRVLAPVDGCKKCHSPEMQGAAHGSSYLDTRACVMCHSPIGTSYGDEMQADEAWLTSLVHKIHSAIPMAAFPTRIGGLGYGAVKYPQDVRNCTTCHTGNEGMTTAWETNPTAEACGTCHDDVDFPSGTNHVGGPQPNNNFCSGCHPATGVPAAVEEAHTIVPAAVDVPEFTVAMVINAPANGTHYVTGEVLQIAVTLTNTSGAIDPAFYTTPQGAAGDTSDTALRSASVYIYGPRAKSVPVLATNTITDPAYDPTTLPTQGHSLFVGGTDPLVQTDATGFKYESLPIPAGMEAGTYMVRVRTGDYGRVGSGDYHIESTAFQTIQIGTATAEEKVAGDACVGCHGTGNFEPHNERHSVVFDTDECLSCHDQSGNHAIPIANRAHAIHSANSDGDLYNIEGGSRDWEEVTYPQDVDRCVTCHNSGNNVYKTNPFEMPCAGCHVENDNRVLDHMIQNGGPDVRPPAE